MLGWALFVGTCELLLVKGAFFVAGTGENLLVFFVARAPSSWQVLDYDYFYCS